MYKPVKSDILIIGSGAAGLRTSIEAYDSGTKNIIIIGKCRKGDAHTVLARGGINAALGTMDPQDNWMIHAADTLREGGLIADYREVEILCKNAPQAINELVKWGARFHRESDRRLTQRFFGAHTYRRTCFYGDQTGKEIMRVLLKQVKKRKIKFLGDIFIYSLLKDKNKIVGALGIDFKRGNIVVYNSKAVVLAAGGYSKTYSRSSSRSYENHGDGAALALSAGIDLVDMEMIQFHPTGMVWPKEAEGTLVTEAVRGEGGILLNSKGERFMKNYDSKRLELGARDEVARAIYNEILEGRGTKHGGVWLDITHLPKDRILTRLPKMYKQFKEFENVDITKEKMEVAPTCHYTMGGVDVSTSGETKTKGLYAVGETVGQIHGANRLGGNSLLETIVFGRIVGKEAAEFAKKNKISKLNEKEIHNKINEIEKFFGKSTAKSDKVREKLQKAMWRYVGLLRDEKGLNEGLKKVMKIKKLFKKVRARKGLKNNSDLKITLETQKMLELCEAIIKSAIMRKESRGAHYRTDYPNQDNNNWNVNIIYRKGKLTKRKVPEVKVGLKKVLEQKIEVAPHKLLE